jgi:DNA-binding beta-propeller fold protein YncE
MIVGSGDYRYEVNADWAKLPDGWSFKEVGGVGVDSNDNVYVFNRGDHPMMVFDREGNFLRSWGEGQYPRAHGVHIAPDGTMFLTDDGGHFVRKVTLDGKVLLELGVPGKPAPYMSGEPFHRCTHTALSPQGDIYVSDGYGNSRVHKYTPDGKLVLSWGEPGTGEGEFNIVHNICCDADGWVYVADRENHRVQVFDGNGRFETQWQNLHRPCGLCMPYGHQPIFYAGEVGPAAAVSRDIPNLGPRVSIVDHQGKLIGRFGETPAGIELGKFLAPHGLAVDSRGDVYVGEVSWTAWPQIYPDTPRPDHIRSLQKFEKVG